MKRREVIQKLAYSVPASMALPSLLLSCDENKIDPTPLYAGNVIVLGAGAAGLYTAKQFIDKNIDVKVLEATDRYGGRIRLQKEYFDFPMEQGADWLHGNSNLWYDSVAGSGTTVIEYPDSPVFSWDGEIKTRDELDNNGDFLIAMNFINDIINYNGPDLTIRNAVFSAGLNTNTHYIVDAITSNARGSSFESISIKGVSDGEKEWNDGAGKYFAENNALVNVLGGVCNNVLSHIIFNTPVTQVDYSNPEIIKLTDAHGETHECTVLIVTVPINVIKAGDIKFVPQLPINTTAALDRIGMDVGYKVMLSFYVNFWGKEVSAIYTDGTVPGYYAPGMGRSLNDENRILSALIMGKQAEKLAGMTDDEIVLLLLSELDALYGGAASQQFDEDNTYVTDWGDMQYIKGVKSYPMVSGTGAAKQYATPIQNKIFFAGEATALNGNYGTVQGALDSADRVVKEVLEVIL